MKGWIVTEILGRKGRTLQSVVADCKALTGVLRGSYSCSYKFEDWEGKTRTLKELRDRKQIFKTKGLADAHAHALLSAKRASLQGQLASVEANIAAIESWDL